MPNPSAQGNRRRIRFLLPDWKAVEKAAEEEKEVLRMHDEGRDPHDLESLGVRPVADAAALTEAARGVVSVIVAPEITEYIVALAAETRRSPSLALGVSPRGAAMLLKSAKAWAWLDARGFVTPDDVKAFVPATWRHRILLRPEVELEGATADGVLEGVMQRVPVPG